MGRKVVAIFTQYIYFLRKSFKNIKAKYSNVKDKILKRIDSIKKNHINNVTVYHIFFITLIYATTSITFITMICEVSFHFIKS